MSIDPYTQVSFVSSAMLLEQCPEPKMPEIAVVGRSNVGKSSLLNALFRRKQLVKTSATPGKTRLLNFFNAGDQLTFVDLPGYGYNKAPGNMQKCWAREIDLYLNQRPTLALILLLVDLRREPSAQEHALIDWARQTKRQVLLVFTKADKIPASKRQSCAKKAACALGLADDYVITSALAGWGRRELTGAITTRVQAWG